MTSITPREGKIRLEIDGKVAQIVLNRPASLNAIDLDCLNLLEEYIAIVDDCEDIGAVVIRGEGRIFCAGADLKFITTRAQDRRLFGAWVEHWHRAFDRIACSRTPTIAAIHGLALAGGFELIQCCDMAVIAADAQIGDHHARHGFFPGGGGIQRLVRLIGERQAKWLLFSGEWIDATTALQYRLVNEVVPAERVVSRALEMATLLGSRSRTVTANIKSAIRVGRDASLPAALELDRRIALDLMHSEDRKAGLDGSANRQSSSV